MFLGEQNIFDSLEKRTPVLVFSGKDKYRNLVPRYFVFEEREDLGMISNISSRYRFTIGIVCLLEVRKLGRVHCATLNAIKSTFILGRRNTFFEMEKS